MVLDHLLYAFTRPEWETVYRRVITLASHERDSTNLKGQRAGVHLIPLVGRPGPKEPGLREQVCVLVN